jgi:hypothetical protein
MRRIDRNDEVVKHVPSRPAGWILLHRNSRAAVIESERRRADSDYERAPKPLKTMAGGAEALRRTWLRLPWPAKLLVVAVVYAPLDWLGVFSYADLLRLARLLGS